MDRLLMDRRAALGLAVGASVGARSWWTEERSLDDDAISLWVADRDAQAVIGLNRGLLHRLCVPVAHPVALAPATNGGLWVVSALGASRHGRVFEWLRLDEHGQVLARGELHDFLCLRAAPDGGAWILSRRGSVLEHFSGGGPARLRNGVHVGGSHGTGVGTVGVYQPEVRAVQWEPESFDHARAIAVNRAGQVFVNGDDEGFELFEEGQCVDCAGVIESALDMCCAGGDWWILTDQLLLGLSAELDLAEMYEIRGAGSRLIASDYHRGVWLLDRKGLSVKLYEREGRVRLQREWGQSGASMGFELDAGALLIATPGALLVLDETGRIRASQGGFREIVDLALVANHSAPLQ